MHPAQKYTGAEFEAWNERMAQKYNPDHYHNHENPLIRWVERRRTRTIVRFLQPRQEMNILEVGCGAGNIMRAIPVGQLAGIDLSANLLAQAENALAGRGARLVKGDAEALEKHFSKQSFDAIYTSEVLEHVQHPERVLLGMRDMLRDGGIAVVSIPNESYINHVKAFFSRAGLLRRWFPGVAEHMEDEWHLHEFDDALFRRTAKPYFEIERVRAVPFSWMPVRYVYLCRPISAR